MENSLKRQKPEVQRSNKRDLGMIVNIPIIIREKYLFERKKTMDIFKNKCIVEVDNKVQSQKQKQSNQMKKQSASVNQLENKVGKIFINEFWSEKFHKKILKESRIKETLDKISQLHRRNLDQILADLKIQKQENGLTDDQDMMSPIGEQNTKDFLMEKKKKKIYSNLTSPRLPPLQENSQNISIYSKTQKIQNREINKGSKKNLQDIIASCKNFKKQSKSQQILINPQAQSLNTQNTQGSNELNELMNADPNYSKQINSYFQFL